MLPDPFSPYPDSLNGVGLPAMEVAEAVAFWRRQLLTDSTDGKAYYYIANGLLIRGFGGVQLKVSVNIKQPL